VLAGTERPFVVVGFRELFTREAARANDFAAAQNHDVMAHEEGSRRPLSSITQPTVIAHGTADPMFPIEHGEALAAEIPGARWVRLEGAGHGVDRADWEAVAAAILQQP
jgi:pimeloyl-ACP methyl ester carboxylesterase